MTEYYAHGTSGSEGNDGLSPANAKKYAHSAYLLAYNAAPGPHRVNLAGVFDYDVDNNHKHGTFSAIVYCNIAATVGARITVEGYTSTAGDGGIAELDCGSTVNYGIEGATGAPYHTIKNILVRDSNQNGMHIDLEDYWRVIGCRVTGAGSVGIGGDNGILIQDCEVDLCTGAGIDCDNYTHVVNCSVHDNGGYGLSLMTGCVVYSNLLYGNGDAASEAQAHFGAAGGLIVNNTIDGVDKSGRGISFANGDTYAFNNIVTRCLDGLYFLSTTTDNYNCNDYNCLYDNTDNLDGNGDFAIGANSITSDPLFEDEDTADYRLTSSSPCLNAGFDAAQVLGVTGGMDLGAVQYG